jgi:hypothetical protein
MMDRSNVDSLPRLPIRAYRRHPIALALVSLLLCGLAPVAMALPNRPLHPQLATAMPEQPGNHPPDPSRALDAPIAPAPPMAAAMAEGYVDPAGGHPLVRPIETSNPYHGR